jgi:hypothetical protein
LNPGAADRPVPARRGRLGAAIGVVLALATGCTNDKGTPPQGSPAPSAAASSGCSLTVTDKGFGTFVLPGNTPSEGEVRYGLVLENPCPNVALDTRITVLPLDAAGRRITAADGGGLAGTRQLKQLRPGERVNLGGTINNGKPAGASASPYDATKVAGIEVGTTPHWGPAGDAKTAVTLAAENVAVTPKAGEGALVTYTLKVSPASASFGRPSVFLVVRDATGTIVAGDAQLLDSRATNGSRQTVGVWVPPAVANPRIDLSIEQDAL